MKTVTTHYYLFLPVNIYKGRTLHYSYLFPFYRTPKGRGAKGGSLWAALILLPLHPSSFLLCFFWEFKKDSLKLQGDIIKSTTPSFWVVR
ncbi:hypothetical protein RchiOBHm_Chr4g0404831 [Rosa chinensis]|uniref:Uncharacterized protein n=1 Tax=Rosa chinensis TaxID=74649 RepID=A0A2P6QTY3_ROSCH|nr:hypothetical protein RchiOBHm_Chr4g0404831 [Rosa chinensis]